jgi:phosphatidate cytidylyltransferase
MLLSNPLDSSYFLPTLAVVGVLLGGGFLVLLTKVHGDPRALAHDTLFIRWRVWAVIAPIYALCVISGPLALLALLLLLTLQAIREYATLVTLPPDYRRFLLAVSLLAAPAAMLSIGLFQLLLPLLFIAATLQPLIFQGEPGGVRHLAFSALGWGYVAWFLAHLMLIERYAPGGPGILLAIGLSTALSDVGAFTVGKLFGRHKLAPRLSPNKTWEGTVGNLLGAALGVGLMSFALAPSVRGLLLALPPLIALGAVWGDLLESSFKREFGVKDAGTWLPGFGGLLDRIDSLIMVGPLVFYALKIAA